MNTQDPEKRIASTTGQELEVHSIFKTIQGEGPFTGFPAVFIRLAGCNLQCPGCDTDYTSNRERLHIREIIKKIVNDPNICGPRLMVITGGEPFRQNITKLINSLLLMGFRVQVETNGTYPPPKDLHSKCVIVCSPKAGKVNSKMAERANCYKYVMHADSVDDEDGLPILALDHSASPRVARPPLGKTVYVQPMDSGDNKQNYLNMLAVKESCLKFNYILQLQLHKIIGVE